ncbi:fungal specific transcription factor domain-containing protein [Cladophialophora carrionii]|uniref:Fungal specific transcription factor domain-containing protein n=1 Tax=Cladophialophora carrionii TaxID=86049 RepID=A0A1C1D0T9_9EURO|nr:fungal specific transcription factor domain-containing protein [Cladophialophora carrionii]
MERLPVNPRRNKIAPELRKRVAQACNIRRAKCSGGHPCERCRKSARDCVYPQAEQTVSIPRREHDELRARCALLEQALAEVIPSEREREKLLQYAQAKTTASEHPPPKLDHDLTAESQHLREGRILTDPDGTIRYLGESSGATFLNHLREYMATVFPLAFEAAWPGSANPDTTAFISALGRYQTHDSRPLLTSAVDPLILATREQAAAMLAEFRDSAQDGRGAVGSGGIYYWGDSEAVLKDYLTYVDGVKTLEVNQSVVAANAMFAVACQLNPDCAPDWEPGFGQTFFARARHLVGNPLDASIINDATVLALLGFYLLNSNRRDAAYIYISVSMHILIVHGVHRAWMVDERGKRLFWTVYVLDRWLSCLMGRPALVPDEAIKLDLPRETANLPPAAGLRAHVELARISNYIVSNVYDVAREEPLMSTLCIQKSLSLLTSWSDTLPTPVQGTDENFNSDQAVVELHMAKNQLIVLAVRPLLFINVKTVTAEMLLNARTTGHQISNKSELDLCADAARRNVHLWNTLLSLQRPARLSVSSVHYLFNAALALQLYRLLADNDAQGDYDAISFVISVLGVDEGSNRAYAKDCAQVLADFGSLMNRLGSVDLSKTASRGGDLRANGQGLPSHSAIVLSSSNGASSTSYAESYRHSQVSPGSTHGDIDATRLNASTTYDRRAYSELLSWLETDNLQHRFDFPHRFG